MANKVGYPHSCALHIVHSLGMEWTTPVPAALANAHAYDANPDDKQASIIVLSDTQMNYKALVADMIAQGYKPLKTWRNYAQYHTGNLCTLWMRIPPGSVASEAEQFTIPVPPLPATTKKEGHK